MSKWFWSMYRFGRVVGWSIPKSIRMAWRARKGPDPKVIERARLYRRGAVLTPPPQHDTHKP